MTYPAILAFFASQFVSRQTNEVAAHAAGTTTVQTLKAAIPAALQAVPKSHGFLI